jgi:hypothetical protein
VLWGKLINSMFYLANYPLGFVHFLKVLAEHFSFFLFVGSHVGASGTGSALFICWFINDLQFIQEAC